MNEAVGKMMIYPNPASGETNLAFYPTSDCHASLEAFRINGESAGSLMNTDVSKSISYTINIKTSEWSEGIYFVRLILGDEVFIKKLIVLKQ